MKIPFGPSLLGFCFVAMGLLVCVVTQADTTLSGNYYFNGDLRVGNGSADVLGSNSTIAFGVNSTASGNTSIAFAPNSTASGNFSTALGYGAKATSNYTVAAGYKSVSNA